jgi:hypothetical protein
MTTLNLIQFTNGLVTIDIAGQDAAYSLKDKGIAIGTPPQQQAKSGASLLRATQKVIAHAHGNRPLSIKFLVKGTTKDAMWTNLNTFANLVETTVRAQERDDAPDSRKGYVKLRFAGSDRYHFMEVVGGQLDIPEEFYTFNLIPTSGPFVDAITVNLEVDPGFLEGPRTVLEKHGSTTSASGDAIVASTDYLILPPTLQLDRLGGLLAFRHTVSYDVTSGGQRWLVGQERTLAADEYLSVYTDSATNRLQFDYRDSGGTVRSTWITVGSGNFGSGTEHHILLQWGDVAGGLRVCLDGISSSTGDAGNANPLNTNALIVGGVGGRLYLGCRAALGGGTPINFSPGALDDVRAYRTYDGVFAVSAAELAAASVDRASNATTTAFLVANAQTGGKTITCPIRNVRGDLAPIIEASVAFKRGTGSHTAAVVYIGNKVAPASAFSPYLELESGTLQTDVTATADATASNALVARSLKAAGVAGTVTNSVLYQIDAINYSGSYRILAVAKCTTANAIKTQMKAWQGTPTKGSEVFKISDPVTLNTTSFQVIDFGTWAFPLWGIPVNRAVQTNTPITLAVMDDSRTGAGIDWDCLYLIPYEEQVPMAVWASTQLLDAYGLDTNDRLVFYMVPNDDLFYRFGTTIGLLSGYGSVNGAFPDFLTNKVNQLQALVLRSDLTRVYDDELRFYVDYWPRFLTPR